MAEIKFMYKNCDPVKFAERDAELEVVKAEMEIEKANKIAAAKSKMQDLKKIL